MALQWHREAIATRARWLLLLGVLVLVALAAALGKPALGIHHRTESLAEFAPQHREVLERARDRLVLPDQMGDLFKVMALAGPTWPDGAGFAVA